jgi:acetyl esterase/lipase
MGYTRRQAVTALLTANAVRPLGKQLGPFSFAVGWPTGELAPQLLALTVADTAQAVVRGKASRAGLLLAGVSVAGLAYLVSGARKAGALADAQLLESLGPDYLDQLTSDPSSADLKDVAKVAVREIVRPFSMMRPDVERISDVNYTEGGSRARLDIYRPKGVDLTDAPVLVQVHGGGWTIGDKSQQGLMLMNRMAARGWVCVAMNYRLAPKHPFPAQIVDVKKAIAWTREHVAEYGGDPSYLVITGGSAGGHLASLAALTPEVEEYQPGFEDADTSVSACVSFYGIYDMAGITGDKAVHQMRDLYLGPRVFRKKPRTNIGDFELASPITHVAPDSPDFFVIHGTNDSLVSVRPARAFVEKMREVSTGVVSYLELPGTQHAFEVFSSIRSAQVIRAVERWLEWHRVVRRKETSVQSAGTSAKHASAAG